MRKYEIAALLSRRFGYTSYLEICTPGTGGTFSKVDKQQFSRQVRVMYGRPATFSDGEQVDFSTNEKSGERLFGEIVRSGEKFDLVFIDSYHTYKESLRDIVYGLQLVKGDGLLLIHDCFPPDEIFASPEQVVTGWCGLTFAAFLDVVLFTKELQYVTVNSDFGCGIIARDNRLAHLSDFRRDPDLVAQWGARDLSQKYSFFEKHPSELLNLISPEVFRERLSDPTVPNALEKARDELEATKRDLFDSRHALAQAGDELTRIKSTLTWKIRERVHNISVINRLYLAIASALRRRPPPPKSHM